MKSDFKTDSLKDVIIGGKLFEYLKLNWRYPRPCLETQSVYDLSGKFTTISNSRRYEARLELLEADERFKNKGAIYTGYFFWRTPRYTVLFSIARGFKAGSLSIEGFFVNSEDDELVGLVVEGSDDDFDLVLQQ